MPLASWASSSPRSGRYGGGPERGRPGHALGRPLVPADQPGRPDRRLRARRRGGRGDARHGVEAAPRRAGDAAAEPLVGRASPTASTRRSAPSSAPAPSFGSFFTERSLTAGRGQSAIGVNFRTTGYRRLDGRELRDGTFLTTANQFRDEAQPFDEETLTLELASSVLTFTGTFGVTDRLDVSAAVPLVTLSMSGSRVNTYRGDGAAAGDGRRDDARPRRRVGAREVRAPESGRQRRRGRRRAAAADRPQGRSARHRRDRVQRARDRIGRARTARPATATSASAAAASRASWPIAARSATARPIA